MMMVSLPPLPLARSIRAGGYSAAPVATSPFGERTSLLELRSGLVSPASASMPMSPAQQQVTPGSPAAAGGPVQSYSARIDPTTSATDANGKSGALDPHRGGGLLGNMFGWNGSPIYEGIKDSGILEDLAYGLSTGTNLNQAFGNATQHMLAAGPERRKEAQAKQSQQKVLKALAGCGDDYSDIAEGLTSGAIDTSEAWQQMFQRNSDLKKQAAALAKNKGN